MNIGDTNYITKNDKYNCCACDHGHLAIMSVINPLTGRKIKIGGNLHKQLIIKGIIPPETMDKGKVSIVQNSRRKRNPAKLSFHKNSTHFTNIAEIADQLDVSPYDIIKFLVPKFFEQVKMIVNRKDILVVIDGHEPYIDRIINDYIKELGRSDEYYNY